MKMESPFETNTALAEGNTQDTTGTRLQLWHDIKGAIAGSDHDFTAGSIGRAILLLSIPMVLEMVMESVFAVVDIFFVSKLGAGAVAVVGLTESMLTIIYTIAIGLAMATTAMVARRIGEKNREAASIAALQSIFLGVLLALPIGVVGLLFSRELLQLMGATPSVIDSGNGYTSILLGGNIVIMLLFIINAIFRGAGDAAISMRVLWLANGINIVLDPCLIFGLGPFPELGVQGAAIATTIGRGVGVFYQFVNLRKRAGRITLAGMGLKVDYSVIKRLLQLSLGGIGQFFIATSSWIGLMRIMAVFGSESLAGYTIAIRVIMFSILPSWGMSNAAATLVGQNLGARRPERAEKSVWMAGRINLIFLCCLGLLFYTFAEFLMRLFTNNQNVVAVGAQCLRYISFGYPFYAYGMVMIQAFNGAGDTRTPTVLNFFCFWLLEIPIAYFLATDQQLWVVHSLGLKEPGVFLAIIVAESLLGVAGVFLFKRGKWKQREV